MRSAALFAIAAIALATLMVGVELGWRPPLLLWDELARTATRLALWAELTIMCVGLATTLPEVRRPPRLSSFPEIAALSVPGFFVLQTLKLFDQTTLAEGGATLAVGLAGGLALSLLVAFISSFAQREGVLANENKRPTSLLWVGSAAGIAAVLWAGVSFFPRTPDNGQLQEFLTLQRPTHTLRISVKRAALLGEKFGVLSIEDGSSSNGLILEEPEWRTMADLWARTRRDGAHGTMTDTNVSDVATISIHGTASGAHVSLSSKHAPTVDFDVDRASFDAVGTAMEQAGAELRQ